MLVQVQGPPVHQLRGCWYKYRGHPYISWGGGGGGGVGTSTGATHTSTGGVLVQVHTSVALAGCHLLLPIKTKQQRKEKLCGPHHEISKALKPVF